MRDPQHDAAAGDRADELRQAAAADAQLFRKKPAERGSDEAHQPVLPEPPFRVAREDPGQPADERAESERSIPHPPFFSFPRTV